MEPIFFHDLVTPNPPDNLTDDERVYAEAARLERVAAAREKRKAWEAYWACLKRRIIGAKHSDKR
jgi:hypothetical protein